MNGYLLDTNVLILLLREKHKDRDNIIQRLEQVPPESPVFVSVAALAELYVGPRLSDRDEEEGRREIENMVRKWELKVWDITRHTAAVYGDLKARLSKKHNRSKGKVKWPEEWPLPDKAGKLRIDEFDLLMVAHALEYELVLVTNDEMRQIHYGLGEVAADLQVEDWTEPPV